MRYPAMLPILTADDIIKGKSASKDGKKRCLISHAMRYGDRDFQTMLVEKMRLRCGAWVAKFNDSTKTSKKDIARVWNKTVRELGYTEVFYVD